MQKFGNFWVPDADAKGAKNRKKMAALFGAKEGSVEPLELAIEHVRKNKPELLTNAVVRLMPVQTLARIPGFSQTFCSSVRL